MEEVSLYSNYEVIKYLDEDIDEMAFFWRCNKCSRKCKDKATPQTVALSNGLTIPYQST